MEREMLKPSPCRGCRRSKLKRGCDCKNCDAFIEWFYATWREVRQPIRRACQAARGRKTGV